MNPYRLAVGLAATALVVTGWTSTGSIAVGAVEAGAVEAGVVEPAAPEVRVAVVRDHNGALAGGLGVSTVSVTPNDVAATTAELERTPGVLSAEVDTRVSIAEDPYASQQYSSKRVRANLVTDVATGDGTVVAVIDSGVASTHPDLATPLPGARPRVLVGTTFLIPPSGAVNQTGTPGNVDPNGHGTHVAGIIAAARGNGIGVEGIAPDAQILPVRALDSAGFGWSSDVATAIIWAHQQGADVINLSLAGPQQSSAVSAAIDSVTTDTSRGKAPTIVVAAAGNSGTAYPQMWPAAQPRVIAVASSDSADAVASTSSRGSYVDVAAPGVSILSTCTPSTYCFRSGTSMASPLVAGVAALLREQDPTRTGPSVESLLKSTAYDIAGIGTDTASGAGRIDAAAALAPSRYTKVPRPVRLPKGTITDALAQERTLVVAGTASDPDGAPLVRIESTVDGRRSVREIPSGGGKYIVGWSAAPGTHHVCVSVLDTPTRRAVGLGCRDVVVK